MSVQLEIPSVEHPRLVAAALDEAERRGISLARLSQGSGLRMLTDAEVEEMLGLAHAKGVELFLFVSSRNSFDPLPQPEAGDSICGEAAFEDACLELARCAELGVDGVLIADVGLLARAGDMRRAGALGDLKLKSSAALAPRNAATAALYAQLGATSINVAATSSLDDLVAMRAAVADSVTLDVYVENPAGFGGGMLYGVAARLLQLQPVYLKIGLRNAQALYPYGGHLEPMAEASIREKVRRAELLLAQLRRTADPGVALPFVPKVVNATGA